MLTGFLNLFESYNYKLVGNHFVKKKSKNKTDNLISIRSRRNSGRWKQYNQTMYQSSKAGMEYPYFYQCWYRQFGSQLQLGSWLLASCWPSWLWGCVGTRPGIITQCFSSVSPMSHVDELTEVILMGRGVKQGLGLYLTGSHYTASRETQWKR